LNETDDNELICVDNINRNIIHCMIGETILLWHIVEQNLSKEPCSTLNIILKKLKYIIFEKEDVKKDPLQTPMIDVYL